MKKLERINCMLPIELFDRYYKFIGRLNLDFSTVTRLLIEDFCKDPFELVETSDKPFPLMVIVCLTPKTSLALRKLCKSQGIPVSAAIRTLISVVTLTSEEYQVEYTPESLTYSRVY